ncbi:MAG: hypothetical protein M3177_05175 [Pseudomonadota bacterium]|nr:hypothetical protein [Pseudomonadota bacterium]
MRRRFDGADVEVVRTHAQAEFRAALRGCRSRDVEPEIRTQEQLSGDNSVNMFIGGIIGSFARSSRACRRPPRILSVSREHVPELIAATSRLRGESGH